MKKSKHHTTRHCVSTSSRKHVRRVLASSRERGLALLAPRKRGRPMFVASSYQSAIFDYIQYETGHLVVEAVAGSGKSTTLVEAAKLLPSTSRALFAAFNNHIAKELGEKLQA